MAEDATDAARKVCEELKKQMDMRSLKSVFGRRREKDGVKCDAQSVIVFLRMVCVFVS